MGRHISIHALLAESDGSARGISSCTAISIHALLAESDKYHTADRARAYISIHALLAESDFVGLSALAPKQFLSTLSLRRATSLWLELVRRLYHFYPRSPSGERRYPTLFDDLQVPISIHALLAESDHRGLTLLYSIVGFLSTLSLRRATSQCRTFANGM